MERLAKVYDYLTDSAARPATMNWRHHLYRLQQRLALTHRESRTLAVLLILLVAGLLVRHLRYHALPYDEAFYAEIDAAFAEASEKHIRRDTLAQRPDTSAASSESPGVPAGDGLVHLNRATRAELERLPRIGPKTAERIIAFRESRGSFRRVEDLLLVQGIGEKTLESLRPLITVE